ncbi:MAG: bisanhydrobacterioruberin hydratase [Salinigranum sp.]
MARRPSGRPSGGGPPDLPTRREVERLLARLVRENRFTVAVVFPLVGAALLAGSAEGLLPAGLRFDPALLLVGTLVMRLPLVAGLLPAVDRRAGAVLLALTAYAYGIEFLGVSTGWPYGAFGYGVALGPTIAGVPVALPVFFLPLVLNASLLSRLLLGARADRRAIRVPVTVGLVVAIDLVLDPGAVALGFWTFAAGGAYYGVPASNYAGWVLSGTVAVAAVDLAFPGRTLRDRLRTCEFALDDHVSFVLLWGAINALYANWVPVAVALLLAAGLLRSDRTGLPDLRRRLRALVADSPRG